jgi:VWFA-related protein
MSGARLRQGSVVFLLVLLGSCFANGKSHPALQKESKSKIAVTTRLVNVDVLVQDKEGNPVTGLTAQDFILSDGGHKQKIALFAAPTTSAPSQAPLHVPPDVYTNLLGAHGGVPPSVTIILLDGLNTTLTDQATAREQVLKYLSQIQPQDHVALYTLGSKLTILHDFTTGASSLIAALASYKGSAANSRMQPTPIANIQSPAPMVAQLNAFIDEMNRDNGAFYQERIARMTLEAFEAIGRHVQGIPGRKNLIWVSAAFPICFCFTNPDLQQTPIERYFSDSVEQTAQLLADANVSVYPVDARGLFGVDLGLTPDANGPPVAMGGIQPSNSALMEDMANWTGGRAFYNTNDIMGSIRRAVGDSRLTYVLGYYPDHNEWNGEFRKIKVKVNRPGLQARTREGYFAVPEMPEKTKNVEEAMARIANSPLDATAIGFAVRITPLPVDTAKQITVTLHFDPRPIQFTPNDGRENADIQYAIFELDENGKVLTGTDKSANISVPEAQYQTALKEGMGFDNTLPLLSNANELCVILRDNLTGSAGSVHIPLQKYLAATKR